MHIPDGFLDVKTWAALDVASAGILGLSSYKAARKLQEKAVPLMGVTAAFIFAAQMLNFPVAGGTSGHFLGGVLAAVLLGPWAGFIVMAAVLIIQALVFQDGGILALGANAFNMGLVAAMGGYLVYFATTRLIKGRGGILAGSFIAAWLSVVAASLACAVELAVSGTAPLSVTLPVMVSVHAVIGLGEGIITALAVGLVLAARPDLVPSYSALEGRVR